MEAIHVPHPIRFLLRFHDVLQVLTASLHFFVDVVGTWQGCVKTWHIPSKHEMLIQCRFNASPPSTPAAQQWTYIWSTSRVFASSKPSLISVETTFVKCWGSCVRCRVPTLSWRRSSVLCLVRYGYLDVKRHYVTWLTNDILPRDEYIDTTRVPLIYTITARWKQAHPRQTTGRVFVEQAIMLLFSLHQI